MNCEMSLSRCPGARSLAAGETSEEAKRVHAIKPYFQKKISDLMYELDQEPALRRKMSDLGHDLIESAFEKMAAFIAECIRVSMDNAKAAGPRK